LNIVFVSTLKGSPWGGSEELWAGACSRAIDDGHHVLVSRYEWPETPPKLAALKHRGAELVLRPRRPSKLARLFPRPDWLRQIAAFNPDVVCISQGGAYECAGHRSARPLIRWLSRSNSAAVNLIQFNSRDAGVGARAAGYARWLYRRADVNAFVAQENAEIASERLGMSIPRTRVVVNPVNLSDRSALAWPRSSAQQDIIRFATVARIDARTKGHDLMIDALSRPEWKARSWTWSLFGHGPDEHRFREHADRVGIGDRLKFCGHVSDIRSVWAGHHALLLPSRAEGTPLAMMEAMLLGRPVLVCNVGGCASWVDDGIEGVIAPSATPEEVQKALDRLWMRHPEWPVMGEHARERAKRQLGPDPEREMLNVLLEAAAARRSSSSVHSPGPLPFSLLP
jgi:glycosyltransferase involved in cell wall biosynthesis